jgi:hypothetical protein
MHSQKPEELVKFSLSCPSTTKWGFGNGVGKPTLNQLKMDDVQVMLGSRSVVLSQVGPSIRFRLYTHTDFEFCTPWEQAGGGEGGEIEKELAEPMLRSQ